MSLTEVPETASLPTGARPQARYQAGSWIGGKYQLSEILGQGGMGAVWRARNPTLHLEVAVKLIRPELLEQIDGIAERMLQEARAAASVGHPAIVKVFDFGTTDLGDPFIIMEVLRGESLLAAMKRHGRLSPVRAVQVLLPIVEALGATHARGIIHRDLKPENLFLARLTKPRLQPKVLDFGVAKLVQRVQERLTREGAVVGSPAYMAPEQLSGEADVDGRADVWSLAVVLYQMITEHRPFESENYHASLCAVLKSPPRPIAEHGIDDPELWRILERGLAKQREDRYPEMRAFGRDLALWLIANGVHEDVCEASLEPWLVAASGCSQSEHSFFPSSKPREQGASTEALPAPARLLRVGPQPVTVEGQSPGPGPGAGTRVARVRAPVSGAFRALVPATVFSAAFAFLVAAFWFGQRRSDLGATLESLGLGGVASVLDLESSSNPPPEGGISQPPPPLPKSSLKYAPLPRTGSRAPLLYVDPPTQATDAR